MKGMLTFCSFIKRAVLFIFRAKMKKKKRTRSQLTKGIIMDIKIRLALVVRKCITRQINRVSADLEKS